MNKNLRIPRQSEVLALKIVDDQWFTEVDRERGTLVHKAVNAFIRGLFIPGLKQHQGYLTSFTSWFEAMVKEVRYADGWINEDGIWRWHGPLVSQLGFTGSPDFIGILTGDKLLSVVDWKTSVSKQQAWQLQVSGAYRVAAEDNGYKPIGRCLSLRLDKGGGQAKVTEYGSKMDIVIYLGLLNAWRFMEGRNSQ